MLLINDEDSISDLYIDVLKAFQISLLIVFTYLCKYLLN